MSERPDKPGMAVWAIFAPSTDDVANIGDGRDERYEIGWWNGSAWCEGGTAHFLYERAHENPEYMPTHWAPIPAALAG